MRNLLRAFLGLIWMMAVGFQSVSAQAMLADSLRHSAVKNQGNFGTNPAFAVCDMLEYFSNVPSPLDAMLLQQSAQMAQLTNENAKGSPISLETFQKLLYEKALIPNGFAQLDNRKTSPKKASKKQKVQSTAVLMRYGVPEGAIQILPKAQVSDPKYITQLLESGVRNIVVTYAICPARWQNTDGFLDPKAICGRLEFHTVCIVGQDSLGFVIKNSWGSDWGKGGYATISPELHQNSAQEGMVAWLSEAGYPTDECANCPIRFKLKVTPTLLENKPYFQFALLSTYHYPQLLALEYALFAQDRLDQSIAGGKVLLLPDGGLNGNPWNVPVPENGDRFQLVVLVKLARTGEVLRLNFADVGWRNALVDGF